MDNQSQNQQKIQIKDGFSGGEYANIMQIGFNKEEFLLTFMNVFPPSGRIVSKVITNPGHLKRIVKVLQENLEKYEGSFGEIKEAEEPNNPIGYNK